MINEELKWKKGVTEIARRLIPERLFVDVNFSNNLQTVHTPYPLCKSMISKLKKYCDFTDKKFLVLNLEFAEILMYDFDVDRSCIWYVTDCEQKKKVAEQFGRYKINAVCGNFLYMEEEMKFDCVIMNPPYQGAKDKTKSVSNNIGGGEVWPKFVDKSIEMCKEDGFVINIHPGKWRKPEHKILPTIKKYDLKYIEIHDVNDGLRTFKANTNYDWYILKKCHHSGETVVVDSDKKTQGVDIENMPCIPSANFSLFNKILAKDGEERTQVIYSASIYDHRKVSPNKTDTHIYPCVYGLTKRDGLKIWYSDSPIVSYFSYPKVIVPISIYTDATIDPDGSYGLCEFTFGIKSENVEEAEKIKQAILSEKFKTIWRSTQWVLTSKEWRVFKYFRKDFWKEFV